jgi:DNA ligase-1
METEFRVVVELCEKLEATSKRTLMVRVVADFLKHLNVDEVEPAVSMLLGRAFPKWDQRTLEVSWRTLSGVIKSIANVDWSDFSEAFGKTGDIGAATKIVFERGKIRRQAVLLEKPLTILEVRRSLEAMAETTGYGSRERKERQLETLLGRATPPEAKYMVKIMIGEMRTGFHEGLMELAVSEAFGVSHETVRRASMLTGDIGEVAGIAKVEGGEGLTKLRFQLFRPVKPMLAQTADDVGEAL